MGYVVVAVDVLVRVNSSLGCWRCGGLVKRILVSYSFGNVDFQRLAHVLNYGPEVRFDCVVSDPEEKTGKKSEKLRKTQRGQ